MLQQSTYIQIDLDSGCGGPGRLDSHRAGISQGRCRGFGFDFPGFYNNWIERCGACGQPPTCGQAVGNA